MANKGTVVGNATIKVTPTMDDQAVSDLERKGKSSGDKSGHRFGDAFTVAAGNLISSGIQKVLSASVDVFKEAFSGFANYEQLVGGVDTLFKDSSAKVQQYAANAYQTAGMSANQYMEQVTSFSASLLQGLEGNTSAAADYADMAMTDMSDNANKMGTSMESITNAYQGFAKQNYTMLDNLKLGYGGTKTEMERLLKDASAIAGVEFNIDNYHDVIQAIHVMQTSMDISGYSVNDLTQKLSDMSLTADELQKVADDLGITYEEAAERMQNGTLSAKDAQVLLGTTAKEAATTIEGSLNMAKAAWSNFMTGLFDENADIGDLFERFATSVSLALENVVPRIGVLVKRVVMQLPEGVTSALQLLPTVIGPTLRKVFGEDLGAQMAESFKVAVDGFISGASQLWDGFLGVFDSLKSGVDLVMAFVTSRIEYGGFDIEGMINGLINFLTSTLFPTIQSIIDTVAPIIANVVGLVMDAMPAIQDMVGSAMGVVCSVIDSAMMAVDKIMSNVWPSISGIVMTALNTIRSVTTVTWPAIQKIVTLVMDKIASFMDNVWPHISNLVKATMNTIQTAISIAWPIIQDVIGTVMAVIQGVIETVWPVIEGIVIGAVDSITGAIEGIGSIVAVVQSIFDGIKAAMEDPLETAKNIIGGIVDTIKGFFNFDIQWPHIPMPHFAISPSGWQIGDLLKGSIPSLGIDWYATGAFIDGATLIGAGEAGTEMLLPKQGAMMDDFADAVSRRGDEVLIRWLDRNLGPIIAEYAPSLTKREFGRLARGTV